MNQDAASWWGHGQGKLVGTRTGQAQSLQQKHLVPHSLWYLLYTMEKVGGHVYQFKAVCGTANPKPF